MLKPGSSMAWFSDKVTCERMGGMAFAPIQEFSLERVAEVIEKAVNGER